MGGWAEANQLQFTIDFGRRHGDQGDEGELSWTEGVRSGLSVASPHPTPLIPTPLVAVAAGGMGLFKVATKGRCLRRDHRAQGEEEAALTELFLGFRLFSEISSALTRAAFIRPGLTRARVEKKSVPPPPPAPPAGAETLRRASKHAARATRSSRL